MVYYLGYLEGKVHVLCLIWRIAWCLHPEIAHMIMTVFPIQWTFIPEDIKMYFGKHRVSGQICLKSTKLNEIYFFSTELLRVCIICRLSSLFFFFLEHGPFLSTSEHTISVVLESTCTSLQEPIVKFLRILQAGRCHIGTLKLAHIGNIYNTEIAKCYKLGLFTPQSHH